MMQHHPLLVLNKIYDKPGQEPLRSRQWFRHLYTLYKIKTSCLESYLNHKSNTSSNTKL